MKKIATQNWILFIAVLMSSISILLCIWSAANNSTKDARIDQIITILKSDTSTSYNKDSLINQLQIREFKEEYYVSQLGIQSDWLILYISILFVITGLVGYTSFVNTINQIDTKVDNAINEQEKKHALHVNEFRALKIQHFDSVSNISQMASATFFKEGLTYEALKNGLISVVYKIQAIKISNKKAYNEKLLSLAIHNLKSGLDMLNLIRKNDAFEQFFLEMANYDELRPILDEILKFENREIKDIVVDIASTLKKMFTQSE